MSNPVLGRMFGEPADGRAEFAHAVAKAREQAEHLNTNLDEVEAALVGELDQLNLPTLRVVEGRNSRVQGGLGRGERLRIEVQTFDQVVNGELVMLVEKGSASGPWRITNMIVVAPPHTLVLELVPGGDVHPAEDFE